MLGVRPALGRFFAPSGGDRPAAEPIAVLDHAFWREVGAPADVVGRTVTVNGVPLTVVAVILWIGCSNVANLLLARSVFRRREIVVRLAAGVAQGGPGASTES